jgi:hypothetical protein
MPWKILREKIMKITDRQAQDILHRIQKFLPSPQEKKEEINSVTDEENKLKNSGFAEQPKPKDAEIISLWHMGQDRRLIYHYRRKLMLASWVAITPNDARRALKIEVARITAGKLRKRRKRWEK